MKYKLFLLILILSGCSLENCRPDIINIDLNIDLIQNTLIVPGIKCDAD